MYTEQIDLDTPMMTEKESKRISATVFGVVGAVVFTMFVIVLWKKVFGAKQGKKTYGGRTSVKRPSEMEMSKDRLSKAMV